MSKSGRPKCKRLDGASYMRFKKPNTLIDATCGAALIQLIVQPAWFRFV